MNIAKEVKLCKA